MSDLTLALSALTGGGSGALDAIDGANLSDGDAAIVVIDSGTYHYKLNAFSSDSELSPIRIAPDDNPGTKMWELLKYVGGVDTSTYSSSQTLTNLECLDTIIYVTGTGTITLPAIEEGMCVTIITVGDIEVSIDPNASDKILLDGTALDDGDKITNTSTAGDIAVLSYYSADGWYASTNLWTDGGA